MKHFCTYIIDVNKFGKESQCRMPIVSFKRVFDVESGETLRKYDHLCPMHRARVDEMDSVKCADCGFPQAKCECIDAD